MQGFISGLLHSIAPSYQYHPVLIIIALQCFEIRKWDLHFILFQNCFSRESLVAPRLKHLPAMQETRVRSLSWDDPLEKEMATHSSILAWRIPWTEEPGRLQSMGSQRVGHDWATSLSLSLVIQWIHIRTAKGLGRGKAKTTTKNVLAIWDPLRLLMSFRMHFPISTKSATGVLTDCWIYRSLWVVWTS